MEETMRVVVRVWKKGKTPILMFPDWKENNNHIQMWEPVGQHGAGDYQAVVKQTVPASDEEADGVIRQYEKQYDCQLKRIKKFIQRRR